MFISHAFMLIVGQFILLARTSLVWKQETLRPMAYGLGGRLKIFSPKSSVLASPLFDCLSLQMFWMTARRSLIGRRTLDMARTYT